MKVHETGLPGVLLLEPVVHGDARGWFLEDWNKARFALQGIHFDVMQSNMSRSARGVLRGLHWQWPNPQGKLVSVLEGEVFDVAVDVRRGSPTFGQWTGATLNAENRKQLWVPEGFAHGFVVTSEAAIFRYLCTASYDPTAEAGFCWNDPAVAVAWPVNDPSLSGKDAVLPLLSQVSPDRLPVFVG
jgi:dTDP-4-dehydrorhamnose 3,5-epimerase